MGYFLIDYSIDLESNKNLQDSIINFLKENSGRNNPIKRTLQTIESIYDLIFDSKGCVPCAINEFDNLNLLSSEDLSDIYLMLLSYNDVIFGINYQYNLNNACEINPTLQALTKLIKADNFRQAETICRKYYYNIDDYEEKITKKKCSIGLKEMIMTHLEFFNTCYSKFFYYIFSPYRDGKYDFQYDFYLIFKRISVLEYENNELIEFNLIHNTLFGENGHQIKLTFSKFNCRAVIDYYLQDCLCDSNYMYDTTIILVKYSGFGNYAARFTRNQFDDWDIHYSSYYDGYLEKYSKKDCWTECDRYAPLVLYFQNILLENINFAYNKPDILNRAEIYACINDPLIFNYIIKGSNCEEITYYCYSCLEGFKLWNGKCILYDENCYHYAPDNRCGFCDEGYGLTKDNFCGKCPNNCKICANYECLECESEYGLTNDKLCSPCEKNCLICTYSLCLSCKNGYTLFGNITCIKCDIGCSICDDLDSCILCKNGYSLSIDDQNNAKCIRDKKSCAIENCEECDVFCTICKTNYVLSRNLGCIYSSNSLCLRIDENYNCVECRFGYYLTGNPSYCGPCISHCLICSDSKTCKLCETEMYFNGDFCTYCVQDCFSCIDKYNCLTCRHNYCVSESKPYICGKHNDCNRCLTNLKCRTCKHSLMIPSNIGCECIDGFFKGPNGICLKCKKSCPICKNYSGCLNCVDSSSNEEQNLNCFCDKGFYKQNDKNITAFDACMPCKNNCNICESYNSCSECEKYTILIKDTCFECSSNNISSDYIYYNYLDSFLELCFTFEGVPNNLECEYFLSLNINYEEKFGRYFTCRVELNLIFISLGENPTIVDEDVQVYNFYLKNQNYNCNLFAKYRYSLPFPRTKAILLVPEKIIKFPYYFTLNGMLSTFIGPEVKLEYEWIIFSNASGIKDYHFSENLLSLYADDYKKGQIDVTLTVSNRFKISYSVWKQITCYEDILLIEFCKFSDYSCKVNQECVFFISKILPFYYNQTFNYIWKILIGSNLLIKKVEKNQPSMIIKPNSFIPGLVRFEVYVEDKNNLSGSAQIDVIIIPEKPIIILDRAIGSIPLAADFRVSASQSIDPNTGCSSSKDNNCLKFEWICFKNKKKCEFDYIKNENYLLVSKKNVKDKLFDSFELIVTSEYEIESKLQIDFDFIEIDYVPEVLIREYFKNGTSPRIALFEDFVVEALLLDEEKFKEYLYLKNWVLSTEKNKILSENLIVKVNKEYLKPGLDYRLTFSLIKNDVIFKYYYDFVVNRPPIPGKMFIEPKSGVAVYDLFTIVTNDWTDFESDYPLLYIFGYRSNLNNVKLTTKQSSKIFSTYLSFIGDQIYIYVQAYDSMGDYKEINELVLLHDDIISTNDIDQKLSTQMIQNIPTLVLVFATGIFNRYLYIGYNDISYSYLQKAFTLLSEYLFYYIDNSHISKDSFTQISKILVEMTKNKGLMSQENLDIIIEMINTLLYKCETFGLDTEQSNNLYYVLENSFNHTSELITENTNELFILMDLYEKINQARVKNMFIDQIECIQSKNAITMLYGLEPYKLESFEYTSSNMSFIFLSEITYSSLNSYKNVILSLTYLPLDKFEDFSQNLVVITIFDLESTNVIPIYLNSSIAIEIPFDQHKIQDQDYSCLYLDYFSEQWDDQGCIVYGYTENSIICECTHLSIFTAGYYNIAKPTYNFEFLSFEALGLHISLVLFFIYIIFAIICYNKDKKELKINYQKTMEKIEERLKINEEVENAHFQVNQNEIAFEENDNLTKTILKVLKARLISLTIYFYTDSNHCRLFRCSSAFFELIGIIFFTAVFFNIQTSYLFTQNISEQFEKISSLSIASSLLILKAINLICHFIFKESDLSSEDVNNNNIETIYKLNFIKVLIPVIFYVNSMIIFCSTIVIIIQKFSTEENKLWLKTMTFGIIFEIIGILLLKILFLDIFWPFLKFYHKMDNSRRIHAD